MASDRCRRAGGRASRHDRRQHPARQAQAELHPARRLRRPCRHRQRREGEVHRQEARRQDLLSPHRLCRRNQGRHRRQGAGRALSRARDRESGRADDPARAAGPRPDARPSPLQRRRASARRPESRASRRRGHEPQEQGGCLMSDNRQSLSDLAALTGQATANPAPAEAPEADTAAAAESPAAPAEPDAHGVSTQGPQIQAVLREQQLDKQGRAYATGRRKDAVARVWLKPGSGKIVINGREQETYFARPTLRLIINQVFDVTDRKGQYDVEATVKGGGLSGQAGAVRHGISTALPRSEPALRVAVKREGFLPRDSRVVERKKYGRAKARRSFQFSKR